MTTPIPTIGSLVYPRATFAWRPVCVVVATGANRWGAWFEAEYPTGERARQYASDPEPAARFDVPPPVCPDCRSEHGPTDACPVVG